MRALVIPVACVLMLTVQAAALALAAAGTPARAAQSAGPLPDAPGKALAEQVCGTCHGLDLLVPSTRTAAQWRDTLAVMKTSGAQASDEEWKTLTGYFMANLAYLNVNKATVEEVRLVLDVPEKIAQSVVAERDRQGGFKTIDDLKQIADLDQKRVEALKARLSF